jgi:hypothetical protein
MAARTRHSDATFSHAAGIQREAGADWFNPTLHTDSEFFIDPFLMFYASGAPWNGIHDRLIDFFNCAMEHVAASDGNRLSVEWERAAAMFSFPEPPQFCLGYGAKTIFGSGSGRSLGTGMLEAALRAIRAGIHSIDDFGELMLFGEHFGHDRISDMVCNIAKDDFATYTQGIAERYDLELTEVRIPHLGYDFQHDRWRRGKVLLPANPCWTPNPGVLLVPEEFLDELPKMDDASFWDWVYSNENEQLRKDLGYEITRGLDKKAILSMARHRPSLAQKYGVRYATHYRDAPPQPYNFGRDPSFKLTPFAAGEQFADIATLAVPSEEGEFCDFVSSLIDEFKWAVEERGIWKSFWSKDLPRQEPDAQRLFHMCVLRACKAADIDISPETNAGSGAVDFKFSAGWKRRALVELKFAKSTSYWDNLAEQTPTYMKAEDISCGYIIVIQHADEHCASEFIDRSTAVVERVAEEAHRSYRIVFVDVREKPSASKRKADD